jgi:hypothetical protein
MTPLRVDQRPGFDKPVSNRAGDRAHLDGAEFLISQIRHRDEAYLRIRWTF